MNEGKINPAMVNLGRGMGNLELSMESSKGCTCNRPRGDIICVNCGFKGFGRIEYTCSRHPKTVFLLDLVCCPNCRGFSLYQY